MAEVAGLSDEHGAHTGRKVVDAGACLAHVTEGLREPGPSIDFEQHLGEVHPREALAHLPTQVDKALGFVECIEGAQDECPAFVLGLEPDRDIVGEAGGCTPIGLVELLSKQRQFLVGPRRESEHAAHARLSGFPRATREKLSARITPMATLVDKDVVTR